MTSMAPHCVAIFVTKLKYVTISADSFQQTNTEARFPPHSIRICNLCFLLVLILLRSSPIAIEWQIDGRYFVSFDWCVQSSDGTWINSFFSVLFWYLNTNWWIWRKHLVLLIDRSAVPLRLGSFRTRQSVPLLIESLGRKSFPIEKRWTNRSKNKSTSLRMHFSKLLADFSTLNELWAL